jgi:DNA-binding XRE family transcriptional regulator
LPIENLFAFQASTVVFVQRSVTKWVWLVKIGGMDNVATSDEHAEFCRLVKEQRKKIGLTQVQMAERLGVTQPSYAAIEAGKCEPGLNQILRLAQALNISAQELIPVPVKAE